MVPRRGCNSDTPLPIGGGEGAGAKRDTVWENLKISLIVHGTKANGQVDRVLELFPMLKQMLQRKGGMLSGVSNSSLPLPAPC